jgi:2-dehydro-3-deoxy-D-arabinonate dehydratase
MRVFRTDTGLFAESNGEFRALAGGLDLDPLFSAADPADFIHSAFDQGQVATLPSRLLAPLQSQEIWAAGVTYLRSRVARVSESKDAGGGVFYDKVYEAARPELFFKATPHRVAEPGGKVCIRADSRWNVPEPELVLALNASGAIFGYSIGNDMSSRDIEAENPLYLPQAKVYHRSAALGPCLLVRSSPLNPETEIAIVIRRAGQIEFSGATSISRIKRTFQELGAYLFRSNHFPHGCYLMTGTGIVPPDEFSLHVGDEVTISIAPIGTLVNVVGLAP